MADGVVVMLVEDDFEKGRATRHYFLDQPESGRRYDLKLTQRQESRIQPGMSVRVIGRLADNVLTADQDDASIVILNPPAPVAPVR